MFVHSRPRAFSTNERHLLVIARCQPAVSRRFFRCLGAHLLRSPQTVKFGENHAGASSTSTAFSQALYFPFAIRSALPFRLCSKSKKPCLLRGKQGFESYVTYVM